MFCTTIPIYYFILGNDFCTCCHCLFLMNLTHCKSVTRTTKYWRFKVAIPVLHIQYYGTVHKLDYQASRK